MVRVAVGRGVAVGGATVVAPAVGVTRSVAVGVGLDGVTVLVAVGAADFVATGMVFKTGKAVIVTLLEAVAVSRWSRSEGRGMAVTVGSRAPGLNLGIAQPAGASRAKASKTLTGKSAPSFSLQSLTGTTAS